MDVHPPVDIGTDFLGYRIEELIGRGGMGVVYRAYDLRLKRSVAVKFVAPWLALDERFRERFARETELVMSLEHPNVVPIYDAGDVDGRLYLAMRLVDGPDLGSLLRAEGALEPARTLAICAQIASALDAAHARGLVHRDVKPSNVLLDGSEHVYLADFGLTRSLGNPIAESGEERSIGTPAYLAPEQLEGLAVDGRADVYSLGCLLYECLTGERVFPRDSRLAEAWAHLEEEPPRASRTRRGLPEPVDRVISRALAKEPAERYPTCGALVAAAERELGPRSVRRRALLAGVVVVALAVLAAALAVGIGRGPTHGLLPNSLVRIDPKSLKATEVAQVGDAPDLVVESGGYLWVTNNILRDSNANGIRTAGDHTLTRVDPATGETTPVGGGRFTMRARARPLRRHLGRQLLHARCRRDLECRSREQADTRVREAATRPGRDGGFLSTAGLRRRPPVDFRLSVGLLSVCLRRHANRPADPEGAEDPNSGQLR